MAAGIGEAESKSWWKKKRNDLSKEPGVYILDTKVLIIKG